ncbi:polysaccharide lyase [Lentzea sp. NPDC005914]|uniref:polysaccharide lyase n=1 Tax=Lentzea sp. NPDC005914 TaxID=3154572 RepID=UPI0033D79615
MASLVTVLSPQATALTSTLRPDADVLRQWSGTPGSAWASLDDPVTQPTTVPATDYIYAGAAGRVTEVALTNPALTGPNGTVTAWFYANTGPTTQLRVDAVSQGTVRATTTVNSGTGFAWHSLPAVTLAQKDADDLRLRFMSITGGDTNVRSAYATLVAQGWQQTWSAPGNNLSEWRSLQMPADPPARVRIASPPTPKSGTALRAEVRDGDVAVNSAGMPIPGGWRAEAVGPQEVSSQQSVRYEWSTLLDASYPVNPIGADGRPIWQVITQWHQGDGDVGGPPPIALIIVGDEIRLHLHSSDRADPNRSVEVGQYPVATLARGTWHDFRLEVRWALTGGYVKVWHDGQVVADVQNVQTLFPARANAAVAGTAYLKMGLYRKASPVGSGPFILYHDEVRRLQPQ